MFTAAGHACGPECTSGDGVTDVVWFPVLFDEVVIVVPVVFGLVIDGVFFIGRLMLLPAWLFVVVFLLPGAANRGVNMNNAVKVNSSAKKVSILMPIMRRVCCLISK